MFRLSPAFDDLLKPNRQIALVPADSEEDARRMATLADPMGQNWNDKRAFFAESIETDEPHVIGDIVFRSAPSGIVAAKRLERVPDANKQV